MTRAVANASRRIYALASMIAVAVALRDPTLSYSSRNALTGSMRAILRMGVVARSVTAQSVSTIAHMVVKSYTPTP